MLTTLLAVYVLGNLTTGAGIYLYVYVLPVDRSKDAAQLAKRDAVRRRTTVQRRA